MVFVWVGSVGMLYRVRVIIVVSGWWKRMVWCMGSFSYGYRMRKDGVGVGCDIVLIV